MTPQFGPALASTLKNLFDRLAPLLAGADARAAEHLLRLATAVMLVEVTQADGTFHPGERETVRAALRDKSALSDADAQRLAELAETTVQGATDLFGFTGRINQRFDMPQNRRMVEHMWRVARGGGDHGGHERQASGTGPTCFTCLRVLRSRAAARSAGSNQRRTLSRGRTQASRPHGCSVCRKRHSVGAAADKPSR